MAAKLTELLDRGGLITAPGVGDALTARLVARAGFPCVSMSGFQVAATFGYPDIGLVTLNEMVDQAARICAAVDLPVIVDGDNGHGNALNTMRTVREFERTGAAAIHLEDQSLPKKCGHMQGHKLIDAGEMCGKLRAAADARASSDFLIIARSDAIPNEGLEAAIERGARYREAGADAIMVMGPRSRDDLVRYREAVQGPLVVTMGSWAFDVSSEELLALGYQLVLYPLTTMRRATQAVSECLDELRDAGRYDHSRPDVMTLHELNHVLGLEEFVKEERQYATGF
ncbi:isocitrate lyase/PEP mutase family protein [Ramlibacter henchirensis]|nr:isocitrate lyase/PEP mutase family protein [Ramlibacter henchirensis]